MIKYNLNNFIKGWFIGDFNPSLFQTKDFEIAIKKYKSGDYEKSHMHKISTEYTTIIIGEVMMNNIKYNENDIIVINPGEFVDFKCLTDVITCVVKVPCTKNDKFDK